MAAQTRERQTDSGSASLPILLISFLLVALGLGAAGIVVSYISTTLAAPLENPTVATRIFLFLASYGILIPVMLIGATLYLIRLGGRVYQRRITAAVWARQLLLWVVVALVVLAIQGFLSAQGAADPLVTGLNVALPFVIAGLACAAAYWWLDKHLEVFQGQETLNETSARNAWNLLIPTLFVLVIVAARPLEETFITSLTNQRFAGGADYETDYIGLQNYQKLLAFRFDIIPCTPAEGGGCVTNDQGNPVFPRARDYLEPAYHDQRFKEVFIIPLGTSHQLVFSGTDQDFWKAMGNTFYFTIVSVTLELLLGLGIALILNSKFKGRGLLRTAMLVPWAIPTVVSARLWQLMLRDNTSGVINLMLINLGLISQPQAWLANPDLQIPSMIMVDVWKTTPFMALILLAGLQVIPGDIYEAADVDGASKIRQFFKLTLPLLMPSIAIALIFRTLDAIRVFDVFQVLLGRARLSLATYNHDMLVNMQEGGYASAIGVVIFIIILIFTIVYMRILKVRAE